MVSIALIGDRDETVTAHRAIPQALDIAAERLGVSVTGDWIATSRLTGPVSDLLGGYDGLWCVPASPYVSMEGALAAIRYAREAPLPFLGTCGGFQHALIEYMRSVLGKTAADNLESNPEADMPVIAPLVCSLVEKTDHISFRQGSEMARIFGKERVGEGYHCSYGFNDIYRALIDAADLEFTGFDDDGAPRAFELPGHPFFLGTLFQPERSALKGERHPLISAFVAASAGIKA